VQDLEVDLREHAGDLYVVDAAGAQACRPDRAQVLARVLDLFERRRSLQRIHYGVAITFPPYQDPLTPYV
jgi:hypothetical protein